MAEVGAAGEPLEFSRRIARRYSAYRRWAQVTSVELTEADLWSKWILPDFPVEVVRSQAIRLNQLYRESMGTRQVDPLTKGVVSELFRRGYRLGIVSNTTSSVEVPALLAELEISGCFETVILSTSVGKRKPAPDILLEATAKMDIEPAHCAYIGDRPERDVASAQAAGFGRKILIQNSRNKSVPVTHPDLKADHVIESLDQLLQIFPALQDLGGENFQPEVVYDAAFSSMWARRNFPELGDFLEAARRIGFKKIELNHQLNSSMLSTVDLGQVEISSVHEPCPADVSMEELKERDWLISALDEENRIRGVAAVKRSLDLAHQVGADYIVVHAGAVNSERNLEKKLRALYEQGQRGTTEYQSLLEEMEVERREKGPAHFQAVERSIRELLEYARPFHVRLGIENRYHFMEIASPDELQVLLSLGGADQIGFVLDVGHAYTLDVLGFFPLREWLERFSGRMIGTHLHDVVKLTDHFAPGMGEVDFDLIAAYLPAEANRTCEFQVFNQTGQVKAGLEYLLEHHCIEIISQG